MNNDETIKNLLQAVDNKRAELGPKPKTVWLTNSIFKFNESEHINLNTAKPVHIIKALAYLIEKKNSWDAAIQMIGAKESFEWYGYSFNDWVADFKTRINIVEWDSKKVQLDAMEAKLKGLVSEEARTGMELDSIAALLK